MSLYKRKRSPYWWTNFLDKDGNRVRISTKRKERRAAMHEAARLQVTYRPESKAKTDLDKIKERYLTYSFANNSRTTYDREQSILNRFCEWADSRPVDPLLVEDYKQHRLLSVSRRTINREYDALRSMFNKAVAWNMVDSNPCKEVSKFKIKRDRQAPIFWSKSQVELILLKSEGLYFHDMMLLDLYTGLRKMELVYLEWSDINWQNWKLIVQAKDNYSWQPKGGTMRTVDIPKPCRQMLRARRVKSLSSFIFANQAGKPRLNNLNRDLREFLSKIGLYQKGVGWHTFRHTYASHLAMEGVPLKSIAELLGHKDSSTTEIYSHLSQSHLAEMVERLDFGGKKVVEIKKEQK
jgi:integrase